MRNMVQSSVETQNRFIQTSIQSQSDLFSAEFQKLSMLIRGDQSLAVPEDAAYPPPSHKHINFNRFLEANFTYEFKQHKKGSGVGLEESEEIPFMQEVDRVQELHVFGTRKENEVAQASVVRAENLNNVENIQNREIPGEHHRIVDAAENEVIIQDSEILNPIVANDMRIFGRLWADQEQEDDIEEVEEQGVFTSVLTKSQKKNLKKKGFHERVHFTRRGGHSKSVQ
ncbi:unnamed protein product [Lupinus luteus]|uniref:Uncharacterized protein n=1 Tax=Lupinus luteus TaxID=3873 RepID=A0AAV1WXA2_LUPLU